MENNREFKVLSDREHVLCRPGMYIGQVAMTEKETWLYDSETEKFKYGKISFVPAMLKCVSELLDNSIDVAIDTDFKSATKIQVNVDEKSIEVIDDGIGIPCRAPDGMTSKDPNDTCVVAAWTKLKSGTSFGEKRSKIGTNGVGSACVNIFSKLFIGHSDDGVHQQTIECRDNLSTVKAGKVKASSGKSGVRVYCEPDFERFGLDGITQQHIDLVYQRLVVLAISYPKIKFYFNGRQVKVNEKKFAEMFSDNAVLATSGNTTVIAFPNEYDEFKSFSYVNGIETIRGGSHVDYISSEITTHIRDRLVRKYKSIRPGDVKNKLSLVVMLTGFVNPQFDAQTKESLANAAGDIGRHIDKQIDFDEFAKKISKNEAIVGPIVETFKIKEELKARQELKKVKKAKVKSDKYFPGIGSKKYLFLVEGLSAGGGLMKCLGRDGKYFYCLRGLALNAYDATIQKIAANQEIRDVMNILNVDLTKHDEDQDIEFEKIVIACDADVDGINISSMLFGWWYKLCPSLYRRHKIYRLNTPIVILKDNKDNIKDWFFTFESFRKWEAENKDSKLKVIYLKGLGSLSTSDLDHIINAQGFESLLEEYTLDEKSHEYIDNWLGPDAGKRKQYIKTFDLDINSI